MLQCEHLKNFTVCRLPDRSGFIKPSDMCVTVGCPKLPRCIRIVHNGAYWDGVAESLGLNDEEN